MTAPMISENKFVCQLLLIVLQVFSSMAEPVGAP